MKCNVPDEKNNSQKLLKFGANKSKILGFSTF